MSAHGMRLLGDVLLDVVVDLERKVFGKALSTTSNNISNKAGSFLTDEDAEVLISALGLVEA
jgi:hypothetical protein